MLKCLNASPCLPACLPVCLLACLLARLLARLFRSLALAELGGELEWYLLGTIAPHLGGSCCSGAS